MWPRQSRPSFVQRVMEPRVRDVFVLFSPIPAGPVASPFPVTFPPPFSPPRLGRPHRAPGREVHEEDFPLNHKLSLFARACVCMLKRGKTARQQIISPHRQMQMCRYYFISMMSHYSRHSCIGSIQFHSFKISSKTATAHRFSITDHCYQTGFFLCLLASVAIYITRRQNTGNNGR